MNNLYIIAHNIRSLHNVGSIFRTADAIGVNKIYLCGYTGLPPRREISKVAIGAEERVPWQQAKQTWRLLEQLKQQGCQIIALEKVDKAKSEIKASQNIFKYQAPKQDMALILGHEVQGVPDSLLQRCDDIVHIPMLGHKESLNVSVAFGIAVYMLRQTDLKRLA